LKNTGRTGVTATIVLAGILIGSAAAQPVLTVTNPQSYANYQLNAMIRTFQSCSATPSEYSGVVCGTPTFPRSAFITVGDDGQCSSPSDQNCQFSPSNVTINLGGFVQWQNSGRLNHTVTFDSPTFPVNFVLRPNSSNAQSFSKAGTFKYHDSFYTWLTGTVQVVEPLAPPPKTQLFNLTGPVSWTLVGLNGGTAILTINHQLKLYNVTSEVSCKAFGVCPQKLLFSESGVVEDLIALRTRIESIGITNIILNIPYLYQYIYGYGYGYVGPYGAYSPPPQLSGPSPGQLASNPTPAIISYYPSPIGYFYPPPKVYTAWWVNGSLTLGSIVEVQNLIGSVRASETLNLGGNLGSKDAWMVESQNKQQFSQPPPQIPPGSTSPQYFISNQSSSTSQKYDYGKQSDLMFKYSDSIDQFSENDVVCPTGSSFNGGYCYNGFPIFPVGCPPLCGGSNTLDEKVTVTRTQDRSTSLTLVLGATNISLGSNASPTSSPTSTSPLQSALVPMVYTATGIAATALVGAAVWLALRARKKGQVLDSTLTPLTAPTPA